MTGKIDINPYNNNNNSSNIGKPIFCFTKSECVLKENEIWLEGALVKIANYPSLFKEYEYDYTPEDVEELPEGYFYLQDWRNRTVWGSSDGFGYIEASMPNITGEFNSVDGQAGWGAIYNKLGAASGSVGAPNSSGRVSVYTKSFNAAMSSPIYQDGAPLRPPSIKCRVKTRYK